LAGCMMKIKNNRLTINKPQRAAIARRLAADCLALTEPKADAEVIISKMIDHRACIDHLGRVDYICSGKRSQCRPERFLGKILALDGVLRPGSIAIISAVLRTYGTDGITASLDSAVDIIEDYADAQIQSLIGRNPDRIRILTLRVHLLDASAVIWRLNNGKFLMDKIKSNSQTLAKLCAEIAAANGWLAARPETFPPVIVRASNGREIKNYDEIEIALTFDPSVGVPRESIFRCQRVRREQIVFAHPLKRERSWHNPKKTTREYF